MASNDSLRTIGEDLYLYTGSWNEEFRVKIKKLIKDENLREEIKEQIQKVENHQMEEKKSWRMSSNRFVSLNRIRSKFTNCFITLVDIRVYFMKSETSGAENPTRYGISLKMSEWENILGFVDEIQKEIKEKVKSTAVEIMIECIGVSMLEKIEEIVSGKCYGCQVDHPSQIQHMSNGCLSELEEKIELNYNDARAKLNRGSVISQYVLVVENFKGNVVSSNIFELYESVMGNNEEDTRQFMQLPEENRKYL